MPDMTEANALFAPIVTFMGGVLCCIAAFSDRPVVACITAVLSLIPAVLTWLSARMQERLIREQRSLIEDFMRYFNA